MVPPLAPAAKRSGLDVTRPNGAASLTVDAEDATERGVDGSATDVEGIVAAAAETASSAALIRAGRSTRSPRVRTPVLTRWPTRAFRCRVSNRFLFSICQKFCRLFS